MRSYYALEKFNKMKTELNETGWTCLRECSFLKSPMISLQLFYEQMPKADGENDLWEIIRDLKSDTIQMLSDRGYGRRMTSKYAMMEYLEKDGETEWIDRVKIDVFIALLAKALCLGTQVDDSWDVMFPATGGRMLCTDPGTIIQQLHLDFNSRAVRAGSIMRLPGWFFMVSGDEGFDLWVAEKSHLLQHLENGTYYENHDIEVKRIFVPRYSIFVGRGDVYHSGDQYNGKLNGRRVRYHVLLSPTDKSILNSIYYHNNDSGMSRVRRIEDVHEH